MSLYNRLRPKKLKQVVGNKAIKEALRAIIKQDPKKRPHTFLFSGPSGCGKTTLAKILAKEFGCDDLNIVEVNAANTRGIDYIRDVVDDSYAVSLIGSGVKTLIFDESHQLTTAAQQCLLKVVEDFPSHAYYIFCTTDPQKLIPTIRNRCTSFQVNTLTDSEMMDLIGSTLETLNASVSDKVTQAIIESAEGSPRQAMVSLEQVLTLSNESSQLKLIRESTIKADVIDLCRALLKGSTWTVISGMYKALPDKDAESIRRAILGYMKTVTLNDVKKAGYSASLISVFEQNTYDSGEATLVRMLYEATTI